MTELAAATVAVGTGFAAGYKSSAFVVAEFPVGPKGADFD